MAIKVEFDKNFFDNLGKMTKKQIEQSMNNLVLDIRNDASDEAYKGASKLSNRTGRLGSTMNAKVEKQGNNIVGTVDPTVEFAKYVENGTGIYAGRKRYLGRIPQLQGKNSPSDKGWRIIKGQKPKHFMSKTAKKYKGKLGTYFKLS